MGLCIVKADGTMVQCDRCHCFEHISCRSRRSMGEEDTAHICLLCTHGGERPSTKVVNVVAYQLPV